MHAGNDFKFSSPLKTNLSLQHLMSSSLWSFRKKSSGKVVRESQQLFKTRLTRKLYEWVMLPCSRINAQGFERSIRNDAPDHFEWQCFHAMSLSDKSFQSSPGIIKLYLSTVL